MREEGIVIWLTADPSVLASRAVGSEHRPWLEEEAEAWLREVARERAPLYAEVARLTVNSDDLQPDEVVDVILARLSDTAQCQQWLPADARRVAAGEDDPTAL
jgi:shikimate kinase